MVRACHTPWQLLQNHPSGHLGGWVMLWSAEEIGMNIIKEWTSLPMPELLTRACCRKDWNRISADSSPMFSDNLIGQGNGLNWTTKIKVQIRCVVDTANLCWLTDLGYYTTEGPGVPVTWAIQPIRTSGLNSVWKPPKVATMFSSQVKAQQRSERLVDTKNVCLLVGVLSPVNH